MHKNPIKRKLTFAVVITEMTIFWVFTSCRTGANATFEEHTVSIFGVTESHPGRQVKNRQYIPQSRCQPIMLCGVIIWTVLTGLTNTCIRHKPDITQW
jgi:hypothetical protein